jgi:hypothetical protein
MRRRSSLWLKLYSQNRERACFLVKGCWLLAIARDNLCGMGEHIGQQNIDRRRISKDRASKQTAAVLGRKLLEVVVYSKNCRIGGKLTLDDLAETSEVGDWKMPDFKLACAYVASQGWLAVDDDTLTLTVAGLAAA